MREQTTKHCLSGYSLSVARFPLGKEKMLLNGIVRSCCHHQDGYSDHLELKSWQWPLSLQWIETPWERRTSWINKSHWIHVHPQEEKEPTSLDLCTRTSQTGNASGNVQAVVRTSSWHFFKHNRSSVVGRGCLFWSNDMVTATSGLINGQSACSVTVACSWNASVLLIFLLPGNGQQNFFFALVGFREVKSKYLSLQWL